MHFFCFRSKVILICLAAGLESLALADSQVSIYRPTSELSLRCFGKTTQCFVTRTQMKGETEKHAVPVSEAKRILNEFNQSLPGSTDPKVPTDNPNSVNWELSLDGSRKSGVLERDKNSAGKSNLALMRLEAELVEKLQ